MRIDCYRNLNAAKRNMARFVWSLRLDGLVDSHQSHIYLECVDLRVKVEGKHNSLEAIRRRAAEAGDDVGRKVYAYLRAAEYYLPADLDAASQAPTVDSLIADGYRPLTCNPFREGCFVWGDDRSPAPLNLTAVWLTPFGAFGLE